MTLVLSTQDLREVTAFAAGCAEVVLGIFESERPDDRRPREAIDAAWAFARGGRRGKALRDTAWAALKAAGDAASPAARQAASDATNPAARQAASDPAARQAAGDAASPAARQAAGDTANPAARQAASDATNPAARQAASDATNPATRETMSDAAGPAARTAVGDAAGPAARTAAIDVAGPAAREAARAAVAAAGAAYLHPLDQSTQVKHILGAAAHAARALELVAGDDRAAGAAHVEEAAHRASPAVVDVLKRFPVAPDGGGRVGELIRLLDAALRR